VNSHASIQLYIHHAFNTLTWVTVIPPTLKTAIYGAIIGLISSYFGYTTNAGADGVRRAATNSVVISSLAIILIDVVLVKSIFVLFPESAIRTTALIRRSPSGKSLAHLTAERFSKTFPSKWRREIYADFSDIGGLPSGAGVRVSGLEAGEVKGIEIPSSPPRSSD
jgi:permease MlaE/MlaD protein